MCSNIAFVYLILICRLGLKGIGVDNKKQVSEAHESGMVPSIDFHGRKELVCKSRSQEWWLHSDGRVGVSSGSPLSLVD